MTNADRSEVGKFDSLSSRFWDAQGEFRPLHILNPVRAQFVAERTNLGGARVLDVGCGGGLLCEALARAGAHVTGIDLAPGMIEVARCTRLSRDSTSNTMSCLRRTSHLRRKQGAGLMS